MLRSFFWWIAFPIRLFMAIVCFVVLAAMVRDINEAKQFSLDLLRGER